jgi:hypothetical protein
MAAKDELPGLLNRADEAQYVREHQRLQASPKNDLPHRVRLKWIPHSAYHTGRGGAKRAAEAAG